MTDIVQAFNIGHPFWAEAIRLRKEYQSVGLIVKAANDAGYELTYKQISLGLSRAPVNLNLPARGSKFLRKKYEEYEKSFNSFISMRDLAQEALLRAAEAQEELDDDDPTMTNMRRQHLSSERDKWLKIAFDWSKECTRMEIDMGAVLAAAQEKVQNNNADNDLSNDIIEGIVSEFKSSLPSVNEGMLARAFGGDNIRMNDDGLNGDNEDEEE